jgi:succinylarginine dihydrolase
MCGDTIELKVLQVRRSEVSLTDAISSYLFNSQLVTLPEGRDVLIAPIECQENERVRSYLAGGVFQHVHFVDVRQSMRNGGGPACLRLRVVLNEAEMAATHQGVFFSDELHKQLKSWIDRNYRDELRPDDLADPKLLDESRRALDELSQVLRLGSIYEFQRP